MAIQKHFSNIAQIQKIGKRKENFFGSRKAGGGIRYEFIPHEYALDIQKVYFWFSVNGMHTGYTF